jgi:hypothetical protein
VTTVSGRTWTVRENVRDTLTTGVSESLTMTSALYFPAAVGVPLIVPVLLRASPAGMPVADQMYGLRPPPAISVATYGVVTTAAGSETVLIASAPGIVAVAMVSAGSVHLNGPTVDPVRINVISAAVPWSRVTAPEVPAVRVAGVSVPGAVMAIPVFGIVAVAGTVTVFTNVRVASLGVAPDTTAGSVSFTPSLNVATCFATVLGTWVLSSSVLAVTVPPEATGSGVSVPVRVTVSVSFVRSGIPRHVSLNTGVEAEAGVPAVTSPGPMAPTTPAVPTSSDAPAKPATTVISRLRNSQDPPLPPEPVAATPPASAYLVMILGA